MALSIREQKAWVIYQKNSASQKAGLPRALSVVTGDQANRMVTRLLYRLFFSILAHTIVPISLVLRT